MKVLLLGLLGAGCLSYLTHLAAANRDSTEPPPFGPCNCTDIDPRRNYNEPVEFNCLEQRAFGACDEPFMFQTVAEVPEGYCQITCNRCDCCSPVVPTVLNRPQDPENPAGATYELFLQLAQEAGVYFDLDNPGYEWTVLVPSDQGVRDTLFDMGFSSPQEFLQAVGAEGVLAFLRAHIIPPTPGYVALTTPFLLDGQTVTTSSGLTLTVQRPEGAQLDGSFRLKGINSVGLASLDVPACKSNVIFLDKAIQIEVPPRVQASSGGK